MQVYMGALGRYKVCRGIVDGVGAKYMRVGDGVGIDYTGGRGWLQGLQDMVSFQLFPSGAETVHLRCSVKV